MSDKFNGVRVTEEEAAKGLGFSNVYELRRWRTELGRENSELKYAIQQAKRESSRLRWSLMRALVVLERCAPHVDIPELLLAINVVCGRQVVKTADTVDWDNKLAGWFREDFST